MIIFEYDPCLQAKDNVPHKYRVSNINESSIKMFMKRINNLFDKITDINNIILADKKARKGKTQTYGVKKHDLDAYNRNIQIRQSLIDGTYKTSEYDVFTIYEPKERKIYRLHYDPDRIVHHAIMNVLEPIWINIFTKDTYSCIKNRGIHLLSKRLKKDLKDIKGTKYCAKMDIRKFYPSIDHDILKKIIRKKIKDKKVLKLLDEIIDSANGVPIGNYLSQFFANLYLAYFDHWIKEELQVKYYYRYADDIVLLSNNKQQLRNWLIAIKFYLKYNLKLELKSNYQIFPVDKRGIDFVGYKFYHTYILLRKSIKKKLFKNINNIKSFPSYIGWLKYCNSKNLLSKIYNITNLHFTNWRGILVPLSFLKDKTVNLVEIIEHNKYFELHFTYKNKSYVSISKSKELFNKLSNEFNRIIYKAKYN